MEGSIRYHSNFFYILGNKEDYICWLWVAFNGYPLHQSTWLVNLSYRLEYKFEMDTVIIANIISKYYNVCTCQWRKLCTYCSYWITEIKIFCHWIIVYMKYDGVLTMLEPWAWRNYTIKP